MMFESGKIREIKIFGKYLFFVLVPVITLTYITINDEITTASSNSREGTKKQNFAPHVKGQSKEKTKPNSESKIMYSETELDIKFLFIGVKKCGTTAFQSFVSSHPDIIISHPQSVCNPKPQSFSSLKEARSFLELANRTNKIAIVKNNKCLHNIEAFKRLKKPPKIIVLLCDPTLRAFSDYKQVFFAENFKPLRPFEEVVPEAISVIEAHKNDKDFAHFLSRFRYEGHKHYSIVSVGFYYEYLKEYYKMYKPEDILILSGAELKQDPYLVMHQLESFLGVRHYLDKSKFVRNEANGMYCVRRTSEKTKCIRPGKTEFQAPDETTMEMVKQLYRPYNKKLFQLLNRTFPWL